MPNELDSVHDAVKGGGLDLRLDSSKQGTWLAGLLLGEMRKHPALLRGWKSPLQPLAGLKREHALVKWTKTQGPPTK